MANKRKKTTAIVAGVTALALLLGGTFAWTSISQQAKNETAGIVNVGGRLHDDFDGENKDVYVENFTDPLNGGQPIYARIKLTEYMEVGQDAGGFGADVNGDGKTTAVPVISGTSIDDKEGWPAHIPAELCSTCETGDTCLIHDHWKWTMGGEGDNGGQTIFMPTFNKDKDSLAADINGTYHGTVDTDKVYYDDYVVYTTDETTGGADIAEDEKEAYDGEIYSVIGTEYYDDDTDTADNGGTRQEANVTHTAKQTATAKVITMQEWLADPVPGNYWVYDTDGWAYWANPIMPGEATGLLLDSIVMEKNPGEKCYYAINVVGQFATVGDWEYFTDSTPSDEAMELLETVSKNVATVTVTNADGKTTVDPGDTVNFSANVYVNGQQVLAASDFEWSVLNADNTVSTTSTIENGVLTVGASETSKNLIVVAKAKDEKYLGALGMSSIAVNVSEPDILDGIQFMNVDATDTPESSYPGYLKEGDTWQLKLYDNGTEIENVTWSLELVDDNYVYENSTLQSGTKISEDILTIDGNEVRYAEESTGDTIYTYHVIKITAAAGEETFSNNVLICNEGFYISGLVYIDPETNDYSTYWLEVNKTYNIQLNLREKASSCSVFDLFDPVLPGAGEFTVTNESYEETDAVKIVSGQLTATEAGEYCINFYDPSRDIIMESCWIEVE